MQTAIPVLLLTADDFLWQHWHALESAAWHLTRGRSLDDLRRWSPTPPGVAVIDAELPGLPGWDQDRLKVALQSARVVIISMRPNDEEGVRALSAGAQGYCHAYAPNTTLAHVLGAVASGSVWLGPALLTRLLHQVHALKPAPDTWHHAALTPRECEIARHIARGESNQVIAAAIHTSERTVKAHLTAMFEKLGIHDRLQLALLVHGIR